MLNNVDVAFNKVSLIVQNKSHSSAINNLTELRDYIMKINSFNHSILSLSSRAS